MIPHEIELVNELKDQPFALIGINSDGDREVLKQIMDKNGINWRNAVDGDTSGPIASKWNIQGWPTIYILDHKGVIRFRNLRDAAMENAIKQLLEEQRKEALEG